MANDRSALTDELQLGEDNSDPIKVHSELNSVSSPRPSARDQNFPQKFGREPANAPIVGSYSCELSALPLSYPTIP